MVSPADGSAYITAMREAFPWLVILAVGGTLVVLVAGVVTMLRHGKADARTSNRLMRYRVLFQLAAILLIALAFVFGSR
jgi:Na+-driven multidrug efflux pump